MEATLPTLNELFDNYRFSVMCGLDDCQALEEAIKSSAVAAVEERIRQIKASAETNRPTLHQSYLLGRQGTDKASFEFQHFLEEVKDTKDTILVEAVLSCHDKGYAEFLANEPEETEQSEEIAEEEKTSTSEKEQQGIDAEQTETLIDIPQENLEGILSDDAKKEREEAEIIDLMEKIKKFRTWMNDSSKVRELKEAVERISQLDARKGKEAGELLSNGKVLATIFDKAYKAGLKNDKNALKELKKEAWANGAFANDIGALCMRFDKARKKNTMLQKEKEQQKDILSQIKIPRYETSQSHPFFLGNVAPAKHWRVFVDETGSIFDQSVFEQGIKEKEKGKFVALFIPENSELPALNYHHATDANTQENVNVIQKLFTKGDGCAILGVTLDAMPHAPLDYWFAGLERLFDMSLRFLPDSPEPTTLEFFVENRGGDTPEEVEKSKAVIQRTAETSLYKFARSYPAKSKLIDVKIHNIAKKQTDDKTFLSYNGYVDTLACAWNGRRKELADMLKMFGLHHRCLLEGNAQELPFMIDRLAQGENLSVRQWNILLDSPDAATADSPVSILMAKQGHAARSDVNIWMLYVNETVSHLNSKAIHLTHLDRQLTWLTENMPAVVNMPKRLKLIWLTSKLAEANHHGVIAPDMIDELNKLVAELYVEDAPLCCWAVLNLAVERTNAYCFEEARNIICDFAAKGSLFNDQPPFSDYLAAIHNGDTAFCDPKVAIYGLRYYGQLLSSLGQHEAFLGNHEKANSYFESAIQCFKHLSENNKLDIQQTSSYIVTNLMDYKDAMSIQPQMEEYLGGLLVDVAGKFASSNNSFDKYQHLVMLRYFMELPRNHPAIMAYLAKKSQWKTDTGHPWEMIEFYRALLMDDQNECWKHINTAYDIARSESGPTLLVIACVILCAARYFYKGLPSEKLTEYMEVVIKRVPALGEKRINAIKRQIVEPVEPLQFVKIMLPFNFR